MSFVDPFNFRTNLNGHFCHFKQNFSKYPIDNPLGIKIILYHVLDFLVLPKDEVLKIATFEARPHLSVLRDSDKSGFTIWGPLYSIVAEAAQLINYSVAAINIAREDRHEAFVIFKPDFAVTLIWPQLEYLRFVSEEDPLGLRKFGIKNIVEIVRPIGNVDIDHIWYYKSNETRNIFAFVETLDGASWSAILLSAFFVSLLTSAFVISNFGSQFFKSITTVFQISSHYDLAKYQSFAIRSLIITWLTVTMLLQQYFGGDLAANLAIEPHPKVIDSLNDLTKHNITIYAPNIEMMFETSEARKHYFNAEFDYYEDLTKNLVLLDVVDAGNLGEITFRRNVDACLMGLKLFIEYRRNHFRGGEYRDKTHVSSEGGSSMFHTFGKLLTADETEGQAMDYV